MGPPRRRPKRCPGRARKLGREAEEPGPHYQGDRRPRQLPKGLDPEACPSRIPRRPSGARAERVSSGAAWNVAPVGYVQSGPLFHAPFAAGAVEEKRILAEFRDSSLNSTIPEL